MIFRVNTEAKIVMAIMLAISNLSVAYAQGTSPESTIATSAKEISSESKNSMSAKETYLQFHKALLAANKIDDLSSYMCKRVRLEIEKTPADEKPIFFSFMKETMPKTVTVISEKLDNDTATLVLSTQDAPETRGNKNAKEETKGSVKLLKEQGQWKIDKESWETKMEITGDGDAVLPPPSAGNK